MHVLLKYQKHQQRRRLLVLNHQLPSLKRWTEMYFRRNLWLIKVPYHQGLVILNLHYLSYSYFLILECVRCRSYCLTCLLFGVYGEMIQRAGPPFRHSLECRLTRNELFIFKVPVEENKTPVAL